MLLVIYVCVLIYLCIPLIPGMQKFYQETEQNRKARIISVSIIAAIVGVLLVLEVFMKKDIYNDAIDMVGTFMLTALALYLNSQFSVYEIFAFAMLMTMYMIYNHTSYLKEFNWRNRLQKMPSVKSIVTRRRAQSLPVTATTATQSSQIPTDLTSSLPTDLTPSTI